MATATDDRTLLDRISIASPCSADWNSMHGDDRKRFCTACRLHVHNLSGLTTEQSLELLRAAGQGRLCVRLFRRADGTVLTKDCPVGLRARMRAGWLRATAMLAALWAGAVSCVRPASSSGTAPGPQNVAPQPVKMGEVAFRGPVMGDATVPKAPQPQPVTQPPVELLGKVKAPSPGGEPRQQEPPK